MKCESKQKKKKKNKKIMSCRKSNFKKKEKQKFAKKENPSKTIEKIKTRLTDT